MKVELIDYQSNAMDLLLFTKSTRLLSGETLGDVAAWPEEKKAAELAYMRDTIKSSWEFVGYTFAIRDVTRAFTHQFVRTRNASYAQETQRAVDVRGKGWLTPAIAHPRDFDFACEAAVEAYGALMDRGIAPQDARGVLPTAMLTAIIARFSLRALHEMAMVRLCVRTQGEYQDVFRAMKAAVVAVHPWAEPFIRVSCAATGLCAFPRYTECPVQALTYNGHENRDAHAEILTEIAKAMQENDHRADPRVTAPGRTM